MDLGLLQREAANEIGVSKETIRNWERDWKAPAKRYGPAIQTFLGSLPLPPDHSLPGRLRYIRWTLGLTQEGLAAHLRVNRCTVSAWEAGRSQPNRTHRRLIETMMTSGVVLDCQSGPRPRDQ